MESDEPDRPYPPLPKPGQDEDLELAQQNYLRRERASRSWRVFSRSEVPRFKRRSLDIFDLDSDSDSDSSEGSLRRKVSSKLQRHATDGATSTSRPGPSQETDRIVIKDIEEDYPSKGEHLYRWVMVYENQRGISLFSTTRYSSQSLLPKDPPPFTLVTPNAEYGRSTPVKKWKKGLANITLEDFPLPDGNWRWSSKEWMVDMRDDCVQHDGFEYNWFFRKNAWRSKPGSLNAGAWVRRRRWIRLMERPPLFPLSQDKDEARNSASSDNRSSGDLDSIWQGNKDDGPRLHRAMHSLTHDGKKLEAWKKWVSPRYPTQAEAIRTALRDAENTENTLRSFIFPSSRVEFLSLVTKAGLLCEREAIGFSESLPSFVDRTDLEDVLSSAE